ncbi:MAG: HAMP domain-containing sensor histidine kinase [bacterium]|nr:HAMP domain-containing sensor histidine kinase [bacterium]
MEKGEKFQREKIGKPEYINENCWLVKTLNYSPAKRCQYCELKFHHCLFFQYLIISLILILFLLTLSFLIEGKISKLVVISVFVLVIIYGYFFNKSTEKIIKANFAQRKAKEALEELAEGLEGQVKQRTKELREAYGELKKLDKAKSEFIAMASHQLRTPLSTIKGYISMLIEGSYGQIPEKAKEKLAGVFQSNERLIKIVNELLNISRIELGKMELNKELTQIEDLIQSCYEELKIEAEKKKLNLIWQKPKRPLPKIEIDFLKIRQAILNLIDNALKYTKEGKIEIKTKKTNSNLQISVRDTGEGLTKEEQKNIFESFTRGEAGINYWIEGVGLGLYVAKKYLELHQGKIWVESKGKGKGSTFYIELSIK